MRRCLKYYRVFQKLYCTRSNKLNNVVIVSAVRTPVGSFRGILAQLTAPQLGGLAIEMAIKQAAMLGDEVQQLFMGNALAAIGDHAPARQAASWAGLHQQVSCITVNEAGNSGLKSIILATQELQMGLAEVAVCGGMESCSNMLNNLSPLGGTELQGGILCNAPAETEVDNRAEQLLQKLCISSEAQEEYLKTSLSRFVEAWATGIYDAEILPVRVKQQQKREVLVAQDENLKNVNIRLGRMKNQQTLGDCNAANTLGDGAAALVLTTATVAQRLQMKPLARIISYQDTQVDAVNLDTAAPQMVYRLLASEGILPHDIAMWEVNDACPLSVLEFIKQMQVDAARVNMHGSAECIGHPLAMSGPRLVGHLGHVLQPGTLGCAVTCSSGAASAVLIEKLYCRNPTKSALPVLTLYTKDPCPLCDVLLEELEQHFCGQYQLEKIYITQKENVRFLRLYRSDIPVVFLNGQFLCMHKLNVQLLRRKLELLKS